MYRSKGGCMKNVLSKVDFLLMLLLAPFVAIVHSTLFSIFSILTILSAILYGGKFFWLIVVYTIVSVSWHLFVKPKDYGDSIHRLGNIYVFAGTIILSVVAFLAVRFIF